jgi:hypothetical protein
VSVAHFFDGGRGAAAGEEGGEDDFAAAFFDDIAADDFLAAVVFAFHEDIGLDGFDEFDGSFIAEADDIIDGLEAGENGHAIGQAIDGAGRALEAFDAFVGIDCHDEQVALLAGEIHVLDVAGVENVEDAVGKDDLEGGGGVQCL